MDAETDSGLLHHASQLASADDRELGWGHGASLSGAEDAAFAHRDR